MVYRERERDVYFWRAATCVLAVVHAMHATTCVGGSAIAGGFSQLPRPYHFLIVPRPHPLPYRLRGRAWESSDRCWVAVSGQQPLTKYDVNEQVAQAN